MVKLSAANQARAAAAQVKISNVRAPATTQQAALQKQIWERVRDSADNPPEDM